MVRMYEAQDKSGTTDPGTVVELVNRAISIYASSSDEALVALHRDVASKKLPSGKVYQLCPSVGNAELIRSLAFALDGSCERVFLDPASGLYGELRRIRLPREAASQTQDGEAQFSLFPTR